MPVLIVRVAIDSPTGSSTIKSQGHGIYYLTATATSVACTCRQHRVAIDSPFTSLVLPLSKAKVTVSTTLQRSLRRQHALRPDHASCRTHVWSFDTLYLSWERHTRMFLEHGGVGRFVITIVWSLLQGVNKNLSHELRVTNQRTSKRFNHSPTSS